MRVILCLLVIVIKGFNAFSQKTEVLQSSGFTHDYVVSSLQFIEAPVDTPRLKYIATLQITGEQTHLLVVAVWLDLIKIKAKELGANSYLVENYSEDESSVSLKIRIYFAGENFLKANKRKRKTNSVFVFNQTVMKRIRPVFYLNDKQMNFDSKKYYSFACDIAKPYYLANNESNITAKKHFTKKKKMRCSLLCPPVKQVLL